MHSPHSGTAQPRFGPTTGCTARSSEEGLRKWPKIKREGGSGRSHTFISLQPMTGCHASTQGTTATAVVVWNMFQEFSQRFFVAALHPPPKGATAQHCKKGTAMVNRSSSTPIQRLKDLERGGRNQGEASADAGARAEHDDNTI